MDYFYFDEDLRGIRENTEVQADIFEWVKAFIKGWAEIRRHEGSDVKTWPFEFYILLRPNGTDFDYAYKLLSGRDVYFVLRMIHEQWKLECPRTIFINHRPVPDQMNSPTLHELACEFLNGKGKVEFEENEKSPYETPRYFIERQVGIMMGIESFGPDEIVEFLIELQKIYHPKVEGEINMNEPEDEKRKEAYDEVPTFWVVYEYETKEASSVHLNPVDAIYGQARLQGGNYRIAKIPVNVPIYEGIETWEKTFENRN